MLDSGHIINRPRSPSHHLSQSFTWYLRTTLRLAARYPRSPTDPTTPHEPCPCPYPASHSIYGWTRGGVDAASDQTPSRSTPAGRSPCETPVLIPGASRLHQLRRPHRRSTHASGSYRRPDRGTNGDSRQPRHPRRQPYCCSNWGADGDSATNYGAHANSAYCRSSHRQTGAPRRDRKRLSRQQQFPPLQLGRHRQHQLRRLR